MTNRKPNLRVSIVIPTFNEKQNISLLLYQLVEPERIFDDFNLDILVVDDNSPDGTSLIVEKFAAEFQNVHLLKRQQKQGLGTAYVAGFKYALTYLAPDVILQMDSDLSHDPCEIARFINEIKAGYDFVIGSRYVDGGSTPDWGIRRRTISKGANFIVQRIAGIKVKDCTSGFRAIRVNLLKKLNLDLIQSKGYAFLLSFLYESVRKGAKIKEIPFTFYDRKVGESKLTPSDMIEFVKVVLTLRSKQEASRRENPGESMHDI